MSEPRSKSRIQLDLTDRQFEALKRVQDRLDCNSYSEVFRRALVILERIVERETDEVRFGFVNAEHEFVECWLL